MNKILKRNESIDLMKGVGILLVVLGHTNIPTDLHDYIYSFHIPFFVFIAGIFSKYTSFRGFVISKAKRLLLPFMFYSLLSWLIYMVVVCIWEPAFVAEQLKKLIYILVGTGQNGVYGHGNMALWFLPFLFVIFGLHWFVGRLRRLRWTFVFLIAGSGILMSRYNVKLPANIDVAFILYPFFYLGTYYLTLTAYLARLSKLSIILLMSGGIILHYVGFANNGPVDTASAVLGHHVLLFYLIAFCGILYLSLLCFYIDKIEIINYLGRNSMIILVLHILFIQLFCILIPWQTVMMARWLYGMVETICVIGGVCFFIKIIDKYLPWSIGKSH